MGFHTIANENFTLVISTQGGAVVKAQYKSRNILREHTSYDSAFDVLQSGCFPLVPFGNRIENNTFQFENTIYRVHKNIGFDPLHLHGDGWLENWDVHSHIKTSLCLRLAIASTKNPYVYEAYEHFTITETHCTMTLTVTNKGQRLPFGLGFHPFFPLTKCAMLRAKARYYWTEKTGFLPHERKALQDTIDFSNALAIPHTWHNICFEGWDGDAVISYPESELTIGVTAPSCAYYFLFVSDTHFDPHYNEDYFCFEPMTHCANAHNVQKLGGLRILENEQSLSCTMALTPCLMLD